MASILAGTAFGFLGLPLPGVVDRTLAMVSESAVPLSLMLLAAMPVGANVYLMSREFGVLAGAVASSIVLTTAIAALTTPVALTLIGASPP